MDSEKGKGRESGNAILPTPSHSIHALSLRPTLRPALSQSTFAKPSASLPGSRTLNDIPLVKGSHHGGNHSSNTWTSSSENADPPSDDGKGDREYFISKYNCLAKKHGIRPIVPGDFSPRPGPANSLRDGRRTSWMSRMLRQSSEHLDQTITKSGQTTSKHQRRPSDVASDFVHGNKRDELKNQDLDALVRLCGKSTLFLPTEYAPFSLTLPTCIRALAQALVQHASFDFILTIRIVDTRGIFRISGSARVINALYDYYCTGDNTDDVSSTTRCPTLPYHIKCNPHDIASTFKRFLSGLPGGILGSLSLFDALVAIHSQLRADPEWHRTKESRLRARLIALAIGTIKCQYQRELICAVFGLLCLVGRYAENAPREDENGHPLPTHDLMGYNALGIVFGPLLIGDLINDYKMRVANPSSGLVLLPVVPPKSKEKRRHRRGKRGERKHAKEPEPKPVLPPRMDKIRIANSIAEMLIVHWREVVRQIRSTGSVRTKRSGSILRLQEDVTTDLPSSISEHIESQVPLDCDPTRRRSVSPYTASLIATSSKEI
ncbi:hypothetical protein F4808DRAFT_453026 [Astrocystis sublimbata]|nr:hypothetical protein F4808DRAFT_453026 [Astrocystis sublimbata]